MSGHTPGPWRIGYWAGRCHKPSHPQVLGHPGPSGNDPCVYDWTFVPATEGEEAVPGIVGTEPNSEVVGTHYDELEIEWPNARLIAAAPELLEALRAGPDTHSVEANSGKCVAPCFGCLRRAALAKAEGRS